MAKRERKMNPTIIEKRISEGRGQGSFIDYKPWLFIQDVPSQGLVTRIKGWKTGREHHFLSKLERNYFYLLEWSSIIIDIREQYPLLPLEETLIIANQCGVPHPINPQTKQASIMTTDFFLSSVTKDGAAIEQARTIKPKSELQSRRVLEKLEIERRYWQVRKIDWGIVTECEIPQVMARNIEFLHGYRTFSDLTDRLSGVGLDEIDMIGRELTTEVLRSALPLRRIAVNCDRKLGFESGSSLTIGYCFL